MKAIAHKTQILHGVQNDWVNASKTNFCVKQEVKLNHRANDPDNYKTLETNGKNSTK